MVDRAGFAGVPATGKRIEVGGISIYRVSAEGKLTDEGPQPDLVGMMQQLGVMPADEG